MAETVDCVVIGAGVVGLAVARAMTMADRDVIILEATGAIGTQTSSRNSEVIHAGIYYPRNSLKARLCVQGREMLYAFCESHGVMAKKITKLVFAANEAEVTYLKALQHYSGSNGVPLPWLSVKDVQELEPQLKCEAALLSRETGIIDSHSFMLALQGDSEANGSVLALNSPVISGQARNNGVELQVGGSESVTLIAKTVINCAGLGSQAVSAAIEGISATTIPPLYYAKGSYFYLSGKAPFSRLIYPLPGAASLGLHYTLDLSGQGRFGPDIEWTDSLSYEVDPMRASAFYDAIRAYWPDLPAGALRPGYAGIRPKLQPKGKTEQDFVIQLPQETGCSGYCALYGIESPGLTSSLAIADYVVKRVA